MTTWKSNAHKRSIKCKICKTFNVLKSRKKCCTVFCLNVATIIKTAYFVSKLSMAQKIYWTLKQDWTIQQWILVPNHLWICLKL